MEVEDLPYRAEYAKSGRASCRGCKSQIGKETLRIAVLVQSPVFDGKMAMWYHMSCFFGKQRPKTVGDIAHFESLKYEDQQKIRDKIESNSGPIVPEKKGKKRSNTASASSSKDSSSALKDFAIEYAKSGRASCRGCEQKILKDEIRISKKDYETDIGKRYGGQAMWHHVECFAKLRSELQYYESAEKLPGFNSLKVEDQKEVKQQIPAIKQEEVPAKKLKTEDEVDSKSNGKAFDEKAFAAQSKIIFDFRNKLKQLKKNELVELLEHNDQYIPTGVDAILDHLSDLLTFGALKKCTKCKDGQYKFSNSQYVCKGQSSEWSKCLNTTQDPKRKSFLIPKEFAVEYDFLAKYNRKPGKRLIRSVAPSTSTAVKKKEDEPDGPKVQRNKPALYEMNFILSKLDKKTKSELTNQIKLLGGKVRKDFKETVMAVITTEENATTDNDDVSRAKKENVHVVSSDFINEAKDNVGKIPDLIIKKSLCDWGSDPSTRLPAESSSNKSSKSKSGNGSFLSKSQLKSQTLKLKGGSVVDADSGLVDVAHVYEDGKNKYTTVLSLTDLQQNKNSYYKLQLLEADNKKRYWVFRSWGRIATNVGGTKLEDMDTLKQAKDFFKALFEEKTGNKWDNRENMVKVPDRFYPIDISYEADNDSALQLTENDLSTKLSKSVQELIKMIFDVNTMKQVMMEFELDLEKMPLGKLSRKQILAAFQVLSELQELVNKNESNQAFIDASNRFYTFIPHSFGLDKLPLLNNAKMIQEKNDMLTNLLDMEIAYNLIKNSKKIDGHATIDTYYEQLKADIDILHVESEEYKLINDYVRNTHAATHSHYTLEIKNIFTVSRHGEDKRYKPFRKLHNKKLLWHGSRLTNFAGILSQGLRIAPPEAPVTGYMFGKGIYFADMVSKSANYCSATESNETGLMLLCEVALGEIHEELNANYITKLPKGKHSCKGVGKTYPDPEQSVVKNGVEIPLGKPVTTKQKSSLLYNEYIVYDVAQVNVKYLLEMKFNYK